ncbi:MAG: SO_0444 family Cu/Zn efflux transporter [Verrucomicrobia bacterium]|jgi:uncharacterized membrane protein YraQ (UPF0718 family)|nr:SO_0444 family Cu/Zn efflux transporter [Verrucomicrobiota bacterium]
MTFLTDFFRNTWFLIAEMAPYLLFGFAIAGLLHVLIKRELVERWLGKPGLASVIKASVLGTPMPLCSCSVIPVAASLRKSGATRGATASFLSSTPQTGVDSILATYALLGGLFTAVRVFVAFVCGIVTGYLIELFCQDQPAKQKQTAKDDFGSLSFRPTFETKAFSLLENKSRGSAASSSSDSCCAASQPQRTPTEALRYGFISLPADLGNALIVGLLLAGLITTLLPTNLLTGSLSAGPLAFMLATAISVPLYVCATASIPMAYALIAAGLSPGAALVFLIAGPATNTATIVTVWKMLGRSATAIYLASLLIISWLAGWIFNSALGIDMEAGGHHHHEALQLTFWQHGSGALLIALLLFSIWKSR